MMFSVSPIISSGTVKGALIAGPVLNSDSRAFFVVQNKNLQQNSIGEFVQQLKNDGQTHPYPVNTEQELTNAI